MVNQASKSYTNCGRFGSGIGTNKTVLVIVTLTDFDKSNTTYNFFRIHYVHRLTLETHGLQLQFKPH